MLWGRLWVATRGFRGAWGTREKGFHAQMAAGLDQFHRAAGHAEGNISAQLEMPFVLLEVAENDSEDFGLWDDGDGPPPMVDEDPDTDDENWGRDSDLPLMDFEDITEVAWDDVKEVSLDFGESQGRQGR